VLIINSRWGTLAGWGAFLGGIAAILAILITHLKPSPPVPLSPDNSPPISSPPPSSTPPGLNPLEPSDPEKPDDSESSAIPSPSPESPCPSEMDISKLYADNSGHPEQLKDVCENQVVVLTGYLSRELNSIRTCDNQSQTNKQRCLVVFHSYQQGSVQTFYGTTTFRFPEAEGDILRKINSSLFTNGDHTVKIKSQIRFTQDSFQIYKQNIEFDSYKIISYQPIEINK
jgi:hypothetical protein